MEHSATEPTLRLATLADAEAIDALMKAASRDLFPSVYTPEQTASAIRYVAAVDRVLGDPSFRARAREMAARIAEYDTFDIIESELEMAAASARLKLESPVG